MKTDNSKIESNFFLFMSVDIIDSTQEKYHNKEWTLTFNNFYTEFQKILNKACTDASLKRNKVESKLILPQIKLWKTNGDELLFYISIIDSFNSMISNNLIKPTSDRQYSLILWYMITFKKAINDFNKQNSIKVKGTAWTGNIPGDNSYTFVNQKSDFIGKSIDIGFRISKYSEIGKLVISVELAILLMRDNFLTLRRNDMHIIFQDRVILKGVLNNRAYPIIYIKMNDKLNDLEMILQGRIKQNEVTLLEYLEEYINTTNGQLQYPFISEKEESAPFNFKPKEPGQS